MNDDIIRNLILAAEKIRYQCIGSSTTSECLMYIKGNNELMMLHDNKVIFRTTIPEVLEVHPEIAYFRSNMTYDANKDPDLSDLNRLDVFNLHTLNYARSKYNEYVSAMDNCHVVACQDDLKDNPSFQLISGMKAGDGLNYFQVFYVPQDRTQQATMINIPYFVGLYGIKKADKYGIIVYNFDESHFLVRVIDKKPKLNNIDIIFCILKGI